MRIVLDAMGTDDCPGPDVQGGILAAQELGVSVVLVGDESAIRRELARHSTAGLDIDVVHAAQVITMYDKPSVVTKGKPASSMHVGMNLVKSGQGDAFVTMGNTGAAHAIAMLQTFGRIRGVKRPALSAVFPIFGKPAIFTDIGANADSKPEWMLQFALMGSIYAQHALQISSNPTVGLLSNGEEEGKGNELIKETSELLRRTSLNFIGNVEPKQVFNRASDVVVSDGFTGNILVKVYESGTRYLTENLKATIKSNLLWSLAGVALKGAFSQVKKKLDT
jgi:glycerol-3-phosphate acyltransferase PlsX